MHKGALNSGRTAQNYGDNLDKINVYSVSSQVPISQEADNRFHSEYTVPDTHFPSEKTPAVRPDCDTPIGKPILHVWVSKES